jgi:hypothetical protein
MVDRSGAGEPIRRRGRRSGASGAARHDGKPGGVSDSGSAGVPRRSGSRSPAGIAYQ